MLTARGEEYDKLLGFNPGADGCVSRPFNPKELMARVGAVPKRSGGQKRAAGLTFGGLTIQKEARSVTVDSGSGGCAVKDIYQSHPGYQENG